MKRKQKGFTLVELMVAMVIGLILTFAALQIFMTNQRTFSLLQAVSALHEDGQMAVRYMVADIRQAGRGSAVAGVIKPVVLADSSNGGNDILAINYWGTSSCAGEIYASETEVRNVYSVSGDTLRCSNTMTNATVDLLEGVESFQVLYGVDQNKDASLGVTQFVTADRLAGDSVIVAIRFSLLLSSSSFNQGQTASTTHWVLDEKFEFTDNKLRRVFNSTVQLRNYNWEGV